MQGPTTTSLHRMTRGVTAALACEVYEISDPAAELPLLVLIAKTAREYVASVADDPAARAIDLFVQLESQLAALDSAQQRAAGARANGGPVFAGSACDVVDEAEIEGAGRGMPR